MLRGRREDNGSRGGRSRAGRRVDQRVVQQGSCCMEVTPHVAVAGHVIRGSTAS